MYFLTKTNIGIFSALLCLLAACFGITACNGQLSERQTLEQFCAAYQEEKWERCRELGTRGTQALIGLVSNIYRNLSEQELSSYIRTKPVKIRISKLDSHIDRADATIELDGNVQKNVALVKESNRWVVDISAPLW